MRALAISAVLSGAKALRVTCCRIPESSGHDMRNVRELTYGLGRNVLVLLYSDGIATHWSLDAYEGLPSRHPSLIAGVMYRDHSRRRDDATVIVVRERAVA